MKTILNIFFIVFLFFGNTLVQNIHHHLEHDHSHELGLNVEDCQDCIFIESSDKAFSSNISFSFSIIEINSNTGYLVQVFQSEVSNFKSSRAPPII